ncbi:MAG TPA: HD domain-containing protein [Kribbellaceae bacterium]
MEDNTYDLSTAPLDDATGAVVDPALVERARQIALAAHDGQTDKAGVPYITHPARVAARVAGDPAAEIVAWLHDVVEDTGVTLDDLAAEFPPAIVAAVDAMTKRPSEDRDSYYRRVAADPLALEVKHADLDDNSSPDRLARLDEPTRTRLQAKYAHARETLKPIVGPL